MKCESSILIMEFCNFCLNGDISTSSADTIYVSLCFDLCAPSSDNLILCYLSLITNNALLTGNIGQLFSVGDMKILALTVQLPKIDTFGKIHYFSPTLYT